MMRWSVRLSFLSIFWLFWPGSELAWAEGPLAGKLILVQGEVSVRRAESVQWEKARLNQELYEGDSVSTGAASHCAILCVDESQVRLNEKTLLILKNVSPSPRLRADEIIPAAPKPAPASTYQVPQGEIWLRNKRDRFQFELETPAATATIRGTEINIQVAPNGTTRVTLLDGHVCLANVYGEVCLRPGELGFVLPGQAPSKQVLVQPADAVQWSLYYPGIFSFRDLPLTPLPGQTRATAGRPAQAALIRQGESAYDQGRLEEARQAAEAVLSEDPENGRALTLLGWIALQTHAPEEAQGYFRRVGQMDEMALIGLALSHYRLGDLSGAYGAMQLAYRLKPNPLLVGMASYFALLAGRVDQARNTLEAVSREAPTAALPRALLAQIYLVQNRKEDASREAAAALSQSPNSPLALLTMGLVKLAGFDPPAAVQYLEKTVAADPRFVDAYVYLARIWLGSEYLARAQKTIDKAMRLAPHDGSVLSLAGFVRLAYRDYEDARKLWDRAIKANPRLGEPHLGLAIYHFRCRQPDQGLTEMLSATLLEPRVSLYQSYLGKALYQTRAFDKALEVFDYAKSLDPQDPTPHFYKGIALTDLNRPGEAIQEINQSIALNDNTAIFRSRLGLDQDRALRNYNLARAYDQLRLREWAYSKAVTAVKSDPYNSSAHLFLEKSYTLTPQGQQAAITEDLFFRLLAPANENTFFSFKNDNYTPMFEMPYLRLLAQGGIGAWKEKYMIQEHNLTAYGGWPGAGFYFEGNYVDDRGFRPRNNDFKGYSPLIGVKWEPTVNNSFTGAYQYADFETGDVSNSNDYAYPVLPLQRTAARYRFYEFGFVHRFNPRASLLLYFNYQRWDQHFNNFQADTSMAPFTFTMDEAARQDTEFGNFQLQQHLVLGKHNLMAGFDYFSGNLNFRYRGVQSLLFGRMPLFTDGFRLYQEPPERTYSFYLFDYWRISPKLLIELGVIKDFVKNTRAGFGQPLSNSLWSPIVGINFYLTPKHTLRAAVQRHLITHSAWAAASLIPTETAGFPWLIWLQNGTELRDAGVSWEAEWDAKTFSVLRLTALRSATPNWVAPPGQIGVGSRESVGWKKYQASFIVNRILATYLGLGAGVQWARVVPDYNPLLPPDFTEFRSFLELSFLHRTGLQAGIRGTLLNQNLKNRENNLFGLMDLRVGYEFPHKRGLATLEINNVFNRGFFQALDPATSVEFYPSRRILFKFALYF